MKMQISATRDTICAPLLGVACGLQLDHLRPRSRGVGDEPRMVDEVEVDVVEVEGCEGLLEGSFDAMVPGVAGGMSEVSLR